MDHQRELIFLRLMASNHAQNLHMIDWGGTEQRVESFRPFGPLTHMQVSLRAMSTSSRRALENKVFLTSKLSNYFCDAFSFKKTTISNDVVNCIKFNRRSLNSNFVFFCR